MGNYFFDSSALVKRYMAEAGSMWVGDLTHRAHGNRCYLSNIAGAEVVAALSRRLIFGGSKRTFAPTAIAIFRSDFSQRFLIIALSASIIESAMDLAERHSLRGYDSVQLAVALKINSRFLAGRDRCTLVSADLELNSAAIAEGLTVENPNDHP